MSFLNRFFVFFFKQKTAYEMRISDWSSDVCSSDLDGKLLIGRNFDFYAGDAFSEEKVIAFINPARGYTHAMVTWAGMVGAVSGMNEQGLPVTIHEGKAASPHQAKTARQSVVQGKRV